MLNDAYIAGQEAALQRFKVASIGGALKSVATTAKNFIIGQPENIIRKGIGKSFQDGGQLHWKNVFWPTVKDQAGKVQHLPTWMGRGFNTLLPAYGVVQAARGEAGDPYESRASNILGAVGQGVGGAYGFSGLGMLGGMLGGSLAENTGRGIGRRLQGPPGPPPEMYPPPEQQYMPEPQYLPEPQSGTQPY